MISWKDKFKTDKDLQGMYSQEDLSVMAQILQQDLSGEINISQVIQELKIQMPLQYITHKAHFYKRIFYVDDRVLIPRPETEELVDLVLKKYMFHASLRVIDWCAGSGCIALSLKKERHHWDIWGVDVSVGALEVAKHNDQNLSAGVYWLQDDLLSPDESYPFFDLLISNPPYIPYHEEPNIDAQVKNHEPRLALFVPDQDPLLFYRALLTFSKKHLSVNGCLALEINQKFGHQTEALILEAKLFKSVELLYDCSGNHRFIIAQK